MTDDPRSVHLEALKKDFSDYIKDEMVFNQSAFPDGMDELLVVLVDNRLTLGFPQSVDVSQVSLNFQSSMSTRVPELKQLMYDKEYGTWLSFQLFFDEKGSHLFLFNYDEPVDGILTHYESVSFLNELRRFPRALSTVPEWWRNKLVDTQ